MLEAAYRQRLDADLKAWQDDGIITPSIADAIRIKLGPLPKGINIATVVGILGALLIAAAFLVFVAANWTEVPRPARFVVLLAGISISYGLGALFAQQDRIYLADISATVGSIVFGAAIALTGQMYHLSGDFSAGVLLWAGGALLTAILTNSRGALAVALVTGCLWSGMRMFDAHEVPHFLFVPYWLVCAGLAVAWNAPTARHLVAVAGGAWWTMIALSYVTFFRWEPINFGAAGAAFMFGAGLMMTAVGPQSLRSLGTTLATYAALSFVVVVIFPTLNIINAYRHALPHWVIGCAIAGLILAFAAAAVSRRLAPALIGVSLLLGLVIAGGYSKIPNEKEQWFNYALSLIAMLGLIVSGMLDHVRPRIVAGWIGLGVAIAAITWALEGSMIKKTLFLAVAGAIAIGIASLLGRLKPKESAA
jgi:uncharacterized membrane protein